MAPTAKNRNPATSRLDAAQKALNPFRTMRLPGGDALHRALAEAAVGAPAKAAAALKKVVDRYPAITAARLFLGLALDEAGRRGAAIKAFDAVLDEAAEAGAESEELGLIGEALLDWELPERAAQCFRRAIARSPQSAEGYWRLGRAEQRLGDVTSAIRNLEKAVLLQPSFAPAPADLGHVYRATNLNEAAIASYRRALELDPGNEEVELALDAVIAGMVPQWHTTMLNDTRRNRAYERAILAAVTPTSRVLDVGAGTGLLAMMAARVGAKSVVAVEALGPLADVAEEIVAGNGLADRIRVVHGRSTGLRVGRELAGKANLLVAEIFDCGLLAEGAIEAFEHAREHLLTRNARIIPSRATIHAMPVASKALAAERRVAKAAGFDMSPFNRLAPRLYLQTELNRYPWKALARPVQVFAFDFARGPMAAEDKRIELVPTATGTCHAIAFWFRLHLDDNISIATGPKDPPTHWQQAVYALEPPMRLTKGRPVTLAARHNRKTIFLGLERG